MPQTALILGSRGRFGRNACIAFQNAGWAVRQFRRDRDRLEEVALGADVIVNALNPAYPDWARDLPVLTQDVIRAARQSGATVIIPGNVYVFGAQTPMPWSENSMHCAAHPLGRLRIEMEAAYAESGVRTILLRAGDFLDTCASGNWFDQVMTKKLASGVFTYPGHSDIDHAWAYLPDLARASVALAQIRRDLPTFSDIPYPGYTCSGEDLRDALQTVTGRPVRLRSMSYLPLHLARPFWAMAAPLLEMRYLWETPHRLDGTLFRSLLPGFEETPLQEALARAIGQTSGQFDIHPDQPVAAGL